MSVVLDRRIGPSTARYAVLGERLSHTWSPYIHNTLFLAAARDAVYLPVAVPRERLAACVETLGASFGGFNVTIPYKEAVVPLIDGVDASARACGAVNTVVCREGKLFGYNTDGAGMLRALEEGGVATESASALILGGGGAARAAGFAFLSRGGRVTFAVRDEEKGRRLARALAETQEDGEKRLSVCSLADIPGAYDVMVNCTPVGMSPSTEGCPVDEATVRRCGAVFDAVYNPRRTRLLALAQRVGIPAVEGLGMLYYQAVGAQELWFGSTGVLRETERAVYEALLRELA